jgi:hypothetical protein
MGGGGEGAHLDPQFPCKIAGSWFYSFAWSLYSNYFKDETILRVFLM